MKHSNERELLRGEDHLTPADPQHVLALEDEVAHRQHLGLLPRAGNFEDIWVTIDESPLEPDDIEEKYYAPDFGMVLELDLVTGDRMELVEIR